VMDTGENLSVDVDTTVGDTTAIYDIRDVPARSRYVRRAAARARLIRASRRDLARLRDAINAGWDVGPTIAHEQRRLAALVAADRGSR